MVVVSVVGAECETEKIDRIRCCFALQVVVEDDVAIAEQGEVLEVFLVFVDVIVVLVFFLIVAGD